MNKQEQIEKMKKAMCYKPSCKKCTYFKDKHCYYYAGDAKRLIEAGYINGADFVDWLKSSRFVKPYMDDMDYCMGIDIEVLAEALQEYLKGEGV